MTLLSIQNLGKAYRGYHSELQRIARWFGIPARPSTEHWVLRNISFDIQRGEAVGIVGKNGAGKSTLLKMITGTLQPTEGSIHISGRISAILELGMGFNPELTGRQNSYHTAGLMGYNAKHIEQAIPDIETFAEINEYFDKPVRTYSSGMQMRVAFAVATAFRPDILIVDEALSVGDAYFQHKCMQRIRHFQSMGTSLLFVSHSEDTVRMLCQRAVMLENGSVELIGDAATVMDYYRAKQVLKVSNTKNNPEMLQISTPGENTDSKSVLVSKSTDDIHVEISSEAQQIKSGDGICIKISTKFNDDFNDPHIGFGIRNKMGIVIYEANTYTLNHFLGAVVAGETRVVYFSFDCHLFPGTYELMVGVANGGHGGNLFHDALFFDQAFLIFEIGGDAYPGWAGLYNLEPIVSAEG